MATDNFAMLQRNPYPGRGIVVGLSSTGKFLVLVYWIMGRSENSRNRVFNHDGNGRVFTEAADPAKVTDPSLIIYNAMAEGNDVYVVSNGSQTDEAVNVNSKLSLSQALAGYRYEPDAPNFTPRITAVVSRLGGGCVDISILRRSLWSDGCDRAYWKYDHLSEGVGLCMTTYMGDGNPLPAFTGEPLLMPINSANIHVVANEYWEVLNSDNRVSLAVKFVDVSTGTSRIKIVNKYEKV